MVTDGILAAVQGIIDHFEHPKEKEAGCTIRDMLADYDEDEWESMNDVQKNEWISNYLPKK